MATTNVRSYRAVCFDLDGTLLPMDMEEFLASYFKQLTIHMVRNGADADAFQLALNTGTRAMIGHKDDKLNADHFWSAFHDVMAERGMVVEPGEANDNPQAKTLAEWESLFEEFYTQSFPHVGDGVEPDASMVEAVALLRQKGYPVAVLTMPLFPQMAVETRLRWAGMDPTGFVRMTTYENSTAAKPSLRYYAENLAALGLSGEDVLMVGNNTVEDFAFANLGADVYLVTDYLLDPVGLDMDQVKHGTQAQFLEWVRDLPECADPAAQATQGPIDPQDKAAAYQANLKATEEDLAKAKAAAAAAAEFNEEHGFNAGKKAQAK